MWADVPIEQLVQRLVALLLIASVHGGAVAGCAVLLGDRGPRYDGRLTMSPFAHADVLGGLVFVVFGLGWIRPLAVDHREFKLGPAGRVLVVLAGFGALAIAAVLLRMLLGPLLTTLSGTAGISAAGFAVLAAELCLWFALLNLVPIPPLTGGQVLRAFVARVPRAVDWVLTAAVVAAVATGAAGRALEPAYRVLAGVIIGR